MHKKLVLALLLSVFFQTEAFACSFPPSFYGLPKDSICLGEWEQRSDILDNGSIVDIYDLNGNLRKSVSSRRVFLDDFNRPIELKHVVTIEQGINRKNTNHNKIHFVLYMKKISAEFSGDITNTGDIYAEPNKGGKLTFSPP